MIAPDQFDTSRLVLRRPVREDAETILRTYARDPEVTHFLPWEPVSSLRDIELGTLERIDRHRKGTEFSWVITSRDSGELMGMITANPQNLFLECGFALGRAFWGKGFATEALAAVANWASGQPDVFRLWACCDVEHRASARVLEKAGFVLHGVLPQWRVHPALGAMPRDCLYYVFRDKA